MFYLQNTPGRKCVVDACLPDRQEKEFLFFSGYSYLGMNHVKKFKDLVREGIEKYGVLFPSSRISNTQLSLYKEFEDRLSNITGMQDTVSFSSGFLAGKTASTVLSSSKNIFVAPQTHPAIDVLATIPIDANNFTNWSTRVVTEINFSAEDQFVLLADSVDILRAEIHDFSFVQNIHPSKKIIFLIDDSHGIGILGKSGEGVSWQLLKKKNVEYIITYSLSKAFNIEGGAVSCSKMLAEKLRQHPNYTASTAINPSLIYAFLNSKKLYADQKEKLFKNIKYFKKHLPEFILANDFDLPVFICKDEYAEDLFYKNGIIISSFGYPDPSSKKINRVVINALHKKKDMKQLFNLS